MPSKNPEVLKRASARYYRLHKEELKTRRLTWYQKNKERHRANGRRYYAANRERISERRKRLYHADPDRQYFRIVKRVFGLTEEDYLVLQEAQNNSCAICKKPFTTKPHVDHNHSTGIVRGLLCRACNSMLGFAGDNQETLRVAIDYLRKYNDSPK